MKKIIKLSLAAALATTAMNAAVVDNVKMSGNAKLFYETSDQKSTTSGSMFNKDNSTGQMLFTVGGSANVGMVKATVRHQTLTTMGLENTIVSAPQTVTTNTTDTINYADIANLSVTIGGTTIIAGRQELNTPLCFTEKWNVAPNTFDANVIVNTSLIPNTTLIYADVQSTNADGSGITDKKHGAHINSAGKFDRPINTNMIAASTKLGDTTINAYYYDVNLADMVKTVSATWIDASTNIAGVNLKAIIAQIDSNNAAIFNAKESNAHALSASTKVAGINIFGAYSKVDDGGLCFANVATKTRTALPTQAVQIDGTIVAEPTAETIKIKVSDIEFAGVKLALQHVHSELNGDNIEETDLIIKTKVAGINLTTLLMNFDGDTALRVVANYSF